MKDNLQRVAELLRRYASVVRDCHSHELERFDYLPEIEEAAENVEKAAITQPPEARAQEPVAWAVYDEPTEELIDVTLVKPDGGEPGLRYEPLYMNCDPQRKP